MIKTKLIQLSYKVKNKTIIKKTMINQFYKRKILTTGFAIVQKGEKKQKKHQNAQHTATTKTRTSMASKFSTG